uniref:Rab3 GTPase-activating protein catalytic subunit n=1 Tax=Steinernema glaseri TaxID=37863 RepID=A0A1I7ZJB5_9BILA
MKAGDDVRKADEEIFEISDFTVVTDFEHLILLLETALVEWKLHDSSISSPSHDCFTRLPKDFLQTCTWKVEMQIVKHLDMRLKMQYYKSTPQDTEDPNDQDETSYQTKAALGLPSPITDFVPSIISTQFGVFDFLVISDADSDVPLPEKAVTMIMSAVNCATVNVQCDLPIFIEIGPARNFLFSGVSQNGNVRTSFEGAYLQRPLYNHDNLSGLIGALREKVNTPVTFLPRMSASIQFDYCFKEKLESNFLNDFPSAVIDLKSLVCSFDSILPFGSSGDPLNEFRLVVRWPNQMENVVNENLSFTDLEPDYAPFWFCSVDLNPSVTCLLHDGLRTVVKYISSEVGSFKTTDFIKDTESPSSQYGANALAKLTSDHSSTYKFVSSTIPAAESEEKVLVTEWLDKIFSNESTNLVTHVTSTSASSYATPANQSPGAAVRFVNDKHPADRQKCEHERAVDTIIAKLLSSSKAAPTGSLTERICQSLARALMVEDNGIVLFCHLWAVIVEKLRNLWDNSCNIPGISENQVPDLACSLLHQKLQMLQCCIEAKRRSYELYDETTDFNSDVFFDALEDVSPNTSAPMANNGKNEPAGRKCAAEGLFYLHEPCKQLFVPITQDRSPMTEDMLEEHTEYLSSLSDAESRVNAQISSLMSDMQAFKAANPDCCMGDFVRWHSPRDWVKDNDDDLGHLSERMSTEGNSWQITWNEAHPIPVSLQQRLFNYSGDAEKILQRFESNTIGELISMILPIVFTSSVRRLLEEATPFVKLTGIEEKLKKIARTLNYLSSTSASLDSFLDLLREMKAVELSLSYVVAISSRFTDLLKEDPSTEETVKEFAISLVNRFLEKDSSEGHPPYNEMAKRLVPVVGAPSGPLALLICKLMGTDERVSSKQTGTHGAHKGKSALSAAKYPPPDRKQYVIRWTVPRPGKMSRPVNHRMYVNIASDEFRLCSSVTDDIVLF